MPPWVQAILLTAAAGASIPIGGFLARVESIQPRWLEQELRHSVIAFGGGVLLSAVALVLVPEGIRSLTVVAASTAMLAGGGLFLALDVVLAKRGGSASQLAAMLADFIPEAIALGAMCATGESGTAYLLALMIGLQNLPEGFNAYRELIGSGARSSTVLLAMSLIVLLGPVAGIAGTTLLAGRETIVGVIMLFASGGILYLMFQDIAPQARLQRRWAPPMGAVLGFFAGLIGHMLMH